MDGLRLLLLLLIFKQYIMKTPVIDNTDLHFEHVQWKKELLFWKDEIKTFQNRLDEIVKRWTDKSVLAELDQFQDNYIIHKEKIGELMNEIEAHELNIASHSKANEEVMDRILFKSHTAFREKMDTQRTIYNDLKKRFFQFLSKYM